MTVRSVARRSTALALAVAALSLVGAGAGASFVDQVTVTQDVSTGTLQLAVEETSAGATVGPDESTKRIQLVGITDQKSTFDVTRTFTITNTGSLEAPLRYKFSVAGDEALAKAVNLEVLVNDVSALKDTVAGHAAQPEGESVRLAPKQVLRVAFRFSAADLPNELAGKALASSVLVTTKA